MKMQHKLLLGLTIFGQINLSMAGNYCAGIRGNGELAPAHWGSMARIIENKGLPESVAGGSSAAITLFLLDGVSRNEIVNKDSEEVKRNKQALMLKSFVPHILYLINEDAKAPRLMKMVGNITGLTEGGFISTLRKAVSIARDLPTFFDVLGEYGPLLNPEIAAGLRRNFSFYKEQIGEAVKVFGEFDAKSDLNIFYRKGLVDFKYLGILFGRFADFYAGYGHDNANEKLDTFLSSCQEVSNGKNWEDIVKTAPECNQLLTAALDSYYGPIPGKRKAKRFGNKNTYYKDVLLERSFPNRMIFEKVGSGLNAYPTTSIVKGDAAVRYSQKLAEYEAKSGKGFGDFTLDFDTELSYGYWGRTEGLADIEAGLAQKHPDDLKSQKFTALEDGIWFEVLATSPAEPGLSNLQRIPHGPRVNSSSVINKRYFYKNRFLYIIPMPSLTAVEWFNEQNPSRGVIPFREGIYSAGGWSDLHPTLVLDAKGCDDIVYVTRQGGESVFGQQIFIRLTGYTDKISFWEDIGEGNRRGWTDLSEEEANSPWNRLYNLMNPDSSYNRSVKTASAVYCTDWDKFYIFKNEVLPTLKDAYNAPVFVNNTDLSSEYEFGGNPEGKSPDNFPGCILKKFD